MAPGSIQFKWLTLVPWVDEDCYQQLFISKRCLLDSVRTYHSRGFSCHRKPHFCWGRFRDMIIFPVKGLDYGTWWMPAANLGTAWSQYGRVVWSPLHSTTGHKDFMHHLKNSEFAEKIAFEKAHVAVNIKCCKCNVNVPQLLFHIFPPFQHFLLEEL